MKLKDHANAERFSRAFPIFCMDAFLENFDNVDVRDRFFESVGKSKFSQLKLILLDGS